MDKLDIKSMDCAELKALIKDMGEPTFRADQIFSWLQSGAESFDEMTNISKTLREKLSEKCYIASLYIEKKLVSAIDGTVKYLYRLNDGEYIESVLMKYHHGYTVCASTQVGCRMGCKFCASGINGLKRNLTASEILSQIHKAERDNGIRVSNVVLMGMGEPLDNFDNTIKFLKLVSDEKGLNIGLRHISVSTSGLVNGIKRLSEYNMPITLSISLHSPRDEVRSSVMPINKKYNVDELLSACRDYLKVTGRRISFEYALIDGVNDSDEDAKLLARKLRGMLCHVNLIPANPVVERDFKRPDMNRIKAFQNKMESLGITTTVRRTLGADINASCGQLRREHTPEGGDIQ